MENLRLIPFSDNVIQEIFTFFLPSSSFVKNCWNVRGLKERLVPFEIGADELEDNVGVRAKERRSISDSVSSKQHHLCYNDDSAGRIGTFAVEL